MLPVGRRRCRPHCGLRWDARGWRTILWIPRGWRRPVQRLLGQRIGWGRERRAPHVRHIDQWRRRVLGLDPRACHRAHARRRRGQIIVRRRGEQAATAGVELEGRGIFVVQDLELEHRHRREAVGGGRRIDLHRAEHRDVVVGLARISLRGNRGCRRRRRSPRRRLRRADQQRRLGDRRRCHRWLRRQRTEHAQVRWRGKRGQLLGLGGGARRIRSDLRRGVGSSRVRPFSRRLWRLAPHHVPASVVQIGGGGLSRLTRVSTDSQRRLRDRLRRPTAVD